MLIAQLTDLHVVPEGQLCQGRVSTTERLRQAVTHLKRLKPGPDVVLITGDLTDYGSPQEYEILRSILAELAAPFFIVPGNHDRRSNLLAAFSDHRYLPSPGSHHAHYVIDDYPVRLIGLDTALQGEPYGRLCDTRLDWLDRTLNAAADTPTLIFMHHPPFRTGIPWIDAAGLYGGRRMEAIVARHRQVQRVLCGHAHRAIQVLWAGTIASIAPSSAHAQLALRLSEEEGYQFTYSLEPWSVQLLHWDPHYGLVGHTSYIAAAEEYAPEYAVAVENQFRLAYRNLCDQEYENANIVYPSEQS